MKDESQWKLIDQKCRDRDLNCARIANLLRNGKIVACGENYILICVSYQALGQSDQRSGNEIADQTNSVMKA